MVEAPDARRTDGLLMEALEEAQRRNGGYLTPGTLRSLAAELGVPIYRLHGVATFYPHFRLTPPPTRDVRVCTDLSCRLRGAEGLLRNVEAAARARPAGEVTVARVSCLGRCDGAPAVTVNDTPYWRLDAARGDALVNALRDNGTLPEAASSPPVEVVHADPYAEPQQPRWAALRRVLASEADAVLAELDAAQLKGMGGAGFPAVRKWRTVRANKEATRKYIVCNADESEPATIKDRGIIASVPHLLVEGMAIAGVVTGAREGIIYIRHEYAREAEALQRAIDTARAEGALGERVLGSGSSFELEIFVSPGGYICGEETALLEALEGKRGQPRLKPSIPAIEGLFGMPTVVNNVETLAHVPSIVLRGADWYRGLGLAGAAGYKFVGLSGDLERPGVYEVPFGTTLREIIERWGGGVLGGRKLKAVVPSGASSGFLPASLADTPMEWNALAKLDSMVGSSAIVAVAEGRCIVDLALNVVRFFARESCGKCWPCRVGSEKLGDVLEAMTEGTAGDAAPEMVKDLEVTLRETSICGLGQFAPAPVTSILKHFPDEVNAHLRERRCPAGTCPMRPAAAAGGSA
jgi:NADH:ubiquinone oxidoreductase subunit F (NADH-binding)/NADH:ubiquinone oxidoreductase subunit E